MMIVQLNLNCDVSNGKVIVQLFCNTAQELISRMPVAHDQMNGQCNF